PGGVRTGRAVRWPATAPQDAGGRSPEPGRCGGGKKGAARSCPCGGTGKAKGRHERQVLTAVGPVRLTRGYFTCRRCGDGLFGADAVLGVRGYLTAAAERMAVLARVRDSLARAEQMLCGFAGRVRAEADRLGVTTAADVTVLGDGAEWIWNLAADVVPQADGVLDAFHAVEHIAGAAAAVWGDGTAEAEARTAAGRVALLR